jgi:hypothetical protein
MKCLGYFFLLCGLLNAAAWGQSARKNQAFVVLRCADLSCIASAPSVAGKNVGRNLFVDVWCWNPGACVCAAGYGEGCNHPDYEAIGQKPNVSDW